MNKFSLLLFVILISCQVNGQQDAQFTQFMFNKLYYNPGYAGSAEHASFTLLHRHQWVGLEGAPQSQAFNFHTPFNNNRVGAGLSLNHDKIGPTRSLFAGLSYAYRIPMMKGTLSLGLRAALRHYRIDWNQIVATHAGDDLINDSENSKLLPNAGVGIYYETKKYYLGLSAPHIIKGDISLLTSATSTDIQAVENIHAYFMAGAIFIVNDDIKFKPAMIIKYVNNAPVDMEFNGSLLFMDKFWLGLTYRLGGSTTRELGESIDIIAQYQISQSFRLGMAYDITLSELKDFNSGSYELLLQYDVQKDRSRYTNPRFF